MVRSSRAKIWPFTVTFFPSAADPLRTAADSGSKVLEGVDMLLLLSLLAGSTAGAAAPGAAPGRTGVCAGSSWVLCFHIRTGSPENGSIHGTTARRCSRWARVPPTWGRCERPRIVPLELV